LLSDLLALLSDLLARVRYSSALAGQPNDDIDDLLQVEPGGIDQDRVVGFGTLRRVEAVTAVLLDPGGAR
jgi:hypothetical protein